ncbi:MAG: YraN family protein [Acidobacteria bacterium]|nr:YraN family protein [Acidobacteriota bacterium]
MQYTYRSRFSKCGFKMNMPSQLNKTNDSPLKPERATHLLLGEKGERLAADYLERHGYRIVVTNFILPIGYSLQGRQVTGEIDIVAYDETAKPFALAFIEVKTRTRTDIAAPETAVDRRKQRQIIRTARLYRRLMAVQEEPYRYDVVTVVAVPHEAPEISLLRGFFTETQFAWSQRNEVKF